MWPRRKVVSRRTKADKVSEPICIEPNLKTTKDVHTDKPYNLTAHFVCKISSVDTHIVSRDREDLTGEVYLPIIMEGRRTSGINQQTTDSVVYQDMPIVANRIVCFMLHDYKYQQIDGDIKYIQALYAFPLRGYASYLCSVIREYSSVVERVAVNHQVGGSIPSIPAL